MDENIRFSNFIQYCDHTLNKEDADLILNALRATDYHPVIPKAQIRRNEDLPSDILRVETLGRTLEDFVAEEKESQNEKLQGIVEGNFEDGSSCSGVLFQYLIKNKNLVVFRISKLYGRIIRDLVKVMHLLDHTKKVENRTKKVEHRTKHVDPQYEGPKDVYIQSEGCVRVAGFRRRRAYEDFGSVCARLAELLRRVNSSCNISTSAEMESNDFLECLSEPDVVDHSIFWSSEMKLDFICSFYDSLRWKDNILNPTTTLNVAALNVFHDGTLTGDLPGFEDDVLKDLLKAQENYMMENDVFCVFKEFKNGNLSEDLDKKVTVYLEIFKNFSEHLMELRNKEKTKIRSSTCLQRLLDFTFPAHVAKLVRLAKNLGFNVSVGGRLTYMYSSVSNQDFEIIHGGRGRGHGGRAAPAAWSGGGRVAAPAAWRGGGRVAAPAAWRCGGRVAAPPASRGGGRGPGRWIFVPKGTVGLHG